MNSSDREIINVNKDNKLFFETNKQTFTELLTFVDFADSKLNIGFVEINFARDRDILIEALIKHQNCQDIQFEILNFSDPDLRFLRDELVEKIKQIKIVPNKKLILLITGLEKSIGVIKEYPDVLVNLNFVRDDLRITVPHPLLLFLPDYALTRLAKYAPDFWAWGRKVFYFQTVQSTLFATNYDNNTPEISITSLKLPEKKERIDLLLRLLSEYNSPDTQKNKRNLPTIISIYSQLGNAYNSLGEYQRAIGFHQQSLEITQQIGDRHGRASSLMGLGNANYSLGEYQRAIDFYQQSLEIAQQIGDRHGVASSLNNLGNAYKSLGEYQRAIDYLQQSLEITQQIGDRHGVANAWFNLGDTRKNLQQKSEAKAAYENAKKLYQAMELDRDVQDCDEAIQAVENEDKESD